MSDADWKNATAAQARLVTNKKGLWLFPLLTFLFVVFSGAFLLWPTFGDWQELRGEIEAEEVVLAEKQAKRQSLEKLATNDLEGKLQLLERVLPSHKPVFEFLVAMEHEASMSGVVLGSYTLNPGSLATASAETRERETVAEKPGSMAIMPIEMEVNGTLEQISGFMLRLESLAPLVGLKEMDLSLSEADRTSGLQTEQRTVDVKLDLHYSLKPTAAESKLASRGFSSADEALFALLQSYSNHQIEMVFDSGETEGRENPFGY